MMSCGSSPKKKGVWPGRHDRFDRQKAGTHKNGENSQAHGFCHKAADVNMENEMGLAVYSPLNIRLDRAV